MTHFKMLSKVSELSKVRDLRRALAGFGIPDEAIERLLILLKRSA